MSQYDIHERRADGKPGKLLDTIDRHPEHRKNDTYIEFDGEMHKVMTGTRNFIIVTAECWARATADEWSKA
jgi:hypothetical protein